MRRRLLVASPLLVVAAATGWLAVRGMEAREELVAARAGLAPLQAAVTERRLDDARQQAAALGARTQAARAAVDDPVWAVAAALPLVGRPAAAVRGSALAVDDVVRRVLPVALRAAEQVDPTALRRPDGSIDLGVVRRVQPTLDEAAREAAAVEERTRRLPRRVGVASLSAAVRELDREVGRLARSLRGAASAAEVAPVLLGDDRPRRWLVLIQQVSESRGTGGIVPAYAVLEAAGGRLRASGLGNNVDLRRARIAPPDGVPAAFVERYGPLGALGYWENVNVSADLPVVARLFAAHWRVHSGVEADGVITIDSEGLAHVLAGTGPIDVGGGLAVAPDDLVEYLAVGQYVGADDPLARKERQRRVASAALQRLTAGGGDTLALLRGVAAALSDGRIRLASDDPALRPVLARHGVDGGLPQGPAPVAYPVVFNTAGSKLDHWLSRSVRYVAGDCDGDRRRSTITVRLRSDPPPDLPPYVTIRFDDQLVMGQSRTNQVGLYVYATRGATLLRAELDGEPLSQVVGRSSVLLETGQEAGLPLWQVYVDLPPGQERVLRLDLSEPTAPGAARVPEQRLARPLVRDVEVPTCR